MIPFGAFMQATRAAGSMSAMGNGGPKGGNPAAAKNGVEPTVGDSSESFSAWVRKLTGNEKAAASDGESSDQVRDEATELETIDWDQLMSVIADALERSPELSDDGQTIDGIDISAMQDALQQLANTDIPTIQGHPLQALAKLAMGSENGSHPATNLDGKTTAAVQQMPGIGQGGLALGKTVTGQKTPGTGQEGQSNGNGVSGQKPSGIGLEGLAQVQGTTVSGAVTEKDATPGSTAVTEKGEVPRNLDKNPGEANPAEFKQALQAQQNKEKPVFPVDATAAQPTETSEEKNPEVHAQRLNDGTKKVVRGDDFVASQKNSQQNQPSLSVSSGKDDEQSSTADEDRPDNRRVVRSEVHVKNQSADAGEKDLPKGTPSSEPPKVASPETNRFSETIQDATRTVTEKSSAIQTAPSQRTEAPVSQRFQATVMDQIVDKANLRSVQGRSEIQIRLKPDFLGNVQMNIAADKEQLVVRMITDHPVVKDVVEANLHHLKTELQHQGLTIDRFEVTVNPDAGQQQNREQFAQMFKNPSFQNGQGQDPEPEPEAHHRENGSRGGNHGRSSGDQPEEEGINYFA